MSRRFVQFGVLIPLCLIAIRHPLRGQDSAGVSANFAVSITSTASKKVPHDHSRAVVWLTPVGANVPPIPPRKHFRVTQKDKKFHPDFLVVTQGSTVDFPNLDPWFHNVFSQFRGKRFDLGLYQAGETRSVTFDKAGVSYLFCNIHPEMTAIIVAVDSRYYGVSDKTGRVEIANVPAGRYELHVWHRDATPESMDSAEHIIDVEHGRPIELIKLALKPYDPRHKNKYGKDYEPAPLDPQY